MRRLAISAAAIFLAACSSGEPTGPTPSTPVASVTVSLGTSTLVVGGVTTATATPRDANGAPLSGRTVGWSSNAQSVATVSPTGAVAAVGPGTATITATAEGRTGSATLTVSAAPVGVTPQTLTVTVLDVGQGDAIYIENGGSVVVIDGGGSQAAIAAWITEKGLARDTIDYMILTHAHDDHYGGLREYFKSVHGIVVKRFYENRDAGTAVTLAELRDSVGARVSRGQLQSIDTDAPCGDARAICTEQLAGGAKMHIMKPIATGSVNDRSVAVKLIGPDSASFTMWLSGDAERPAQAFFEQAYGANPGLDVRVMKGNHHGRCNGVTARWLQLTTPEWTTFGVSTGNSFGHVHEQAKTFHRAASAPWLRSDENGRITFRTAGTAGSNYTVTQEKGATSLGGQGDRAAVESTCG